MIHGQTAEEIVSDWNIPDDETNKSFIQTLVDTLPSTFVGTPLGTEMCIPCIDPLIILKAGNLQQRKTNQLVCASIFVSTEDYERCQGCPDSGDKEWCEGCEPSRYYPIPRECYSDFLRYQIRNKHAPNYPNPAPGMSQWDLNKYIKDGEESVFIKKLAELCQWISLYRIDNS